MSQEKKININAIFKGCLLSLISALVLVIITALICWFADVSDSVMSIILFCVSAVSVFIGGLAAAKTAGSKGLLHGLFCTFGYFIILFAASFIVNKDAGISVRMLSMLAAGLAAGMLGGILGINS